LLLASWPRAGGAQNQAGMWKFLLDPVVQGLGFLLAVSAIGFVAWDLFEDARNPAPSRQHFARRREPRGKPSAPRPKLHVEPSVEIWTDAQGETRGRVRRGPCRGARLEDMSREECEAQAAYARDHDPLAAVALENYIRNRFGHERRFETQEAGLSRAQALKELGLREGASLADIHSAYRQMIKRHHPDHGGSHARAARINQAKDLLEK
jgi:hypothetical protein